MTVDPLFLSRLRGGLPKNQALDLFAPFLSRLRGGLQEWRIVPMQTEFLSRLRGGLRTRAD